MCSECICIIYIYVGDYSLPLDHFVLVRSDTLTLEVTMGIRADHAMIACFGWGDVWGPRVRRGVGRCILKREVLCIFMICEVNWGKIYVLCNLN